MQNLIEASSEFRRIQQVWINQGERRIAERCQSIQWFLSNWMAYNPEMRRTLSSYVRTWRVQDAGSHWHAGSHAVSLEEDWLMVEKTKLTERTCIKLLTQLH